MSSTLSAYGHASEEGPSRVGEAVALAGRK
jgi:hypothetical protein